ncbi:MraY family glycosyltransferase [Alistipes shahii]|jgi:UDP-N-acetylmuramyl pentapeptide phosphotransferase/UDP-N-acetylglucosamine-1-phosphate transferase|uniref:MraY family glycosyltransferase n=1 Tax=Alistipes shahii TaxID=328814 RepID=UPI0032C0F7D9
MSIIITYGIIFVILLLLELAYFKVADKYNIIDKPNERSSHSTIVLRGGGIIYALSTLVWVGLQGAHGDWCVVLDYWPFLLGLLLVAGISFVDDIVSLPDSIRLVVQFVSYGMMFWNLGVFDLFGKYGWMIGLGTTILALIVVVGATNVINFMDGVNGITAAYSLSVLVPLFILNNSMPIPFVLNSLIGVVILGVLVFCLFNFRPKGKAKCFAGDVGSIGIAYIMLFMIGSLILVTGDLTYLILLLVYGIDGCLTICHRILLHENLGEAHRKHAYQLMANELKIGHVKVSSFYALLQLVISLGFIYLCPNTEIAHWSYLASTIIILTLAYILFMKKYYHLHEEYLASLKNKHNDSN